MERPHRQLGAGLTDRLGRDDADGLADVDELARRQRPAVALAQVPVLASQVSTERTLTTSMPAATSSPILTSPRSSPRGQHLAGLGVGDRHGRRAGVRRGLGVVVLADVAVLALHTDPLVEATLGAAVVLTDDDVLRHVDETTRQVTRVGRPQRGVGETLAGTVGGDEVPSTDRPSRKLALIGRGMMSPFGLATRPRMAAT